MSRTSQNGLELSAAEKRALLAELLHKKAAQPKTAPMSFSQQRLWFLDQLEPGSATYNISRAARFSGKLDLRALQAAVNAIVARHESLRTNFLSQEGEPVQVVYPVRKSESAAVDLRALPPGEREAEAKRLTLAATRRGFDLAHDDLLRAILFQLSDREHVLLLVMHHIISDGWSMGVLFREFAALYDAFSNSRTPTLPALPIQYGDFARWQQEWLQGPVLEEQMSYWKVQLAGAQAIVELPTDRPRPAIQTFNGGYYTTSLSQELSRSLKDLSLREGVTLFMTLLTAFQTMLSRYAKQQDIVVGTPIANRTKTETEDLIGFFVNTLVLRTDLSGNPAFSEALRRVRDVALDAYAHQDLPFEKLVEELQPERSLSYMPLFQVLFALQNAPTSPFKLPGLEVEGFNFERKTAKFDLSLYVGESADQLTLSFEYNTDLFDDATIERMSGHFQTLLAGVVTDPDQRIADLPLLTEIEQQRMIAEWNNTELDYPRRCVCQLFEEQTERTPEAVALVCEDRQLTYRELNSEANQLAHYLRKQGVGPETLVGIFMDRSPEMVVALLGILKAGGTYLPLDTQYPHERLTLMLDDSGVSLLLTQSRLLAELPESAARTIAVDRDRARIAQEGSDDQLPAATNENLAYVIYTSGSTGKPKGVQITHRALVNFLSAMRRQPGMSAADVLLSVTTLSFDIAGLEIYLPLILGARVVLASREVAADGTRLAEAIDRSGATIIQATPATWRLLIEGGWQGKEELKILCGGEALTRELANSLLTRGAAVWNLYGPTETTIWSTLTRVEATDRNVHIGQPIANTQISILDHRLQMVPAGVTGELYIGGDGLARGYLNRPELTAERFIPDPFDRNSGARLYQTGDLARYLADGNIEIIGRTDHQVKVRGYRIELGEIEAALSSHSLVREGVVTTTEVAPGDQRLVAYFVPNSSETLPQQSKNELESEQVSQWRAIWDQTYDQTASAPDPTFNLSGWNSSYTGLPVQAEEMREWVDNTVARILSLQPTRALEIGCGTGLLLFKVAPHCSQYVGADFSPTALQYVAEQLGKRRLPQVELRKCAADEIASLELESLDTVILNSVVQYFPDVAYLERVLECVAKKVSPGGKIFVGDVRSLALLETFHASVQLHQAASSLSRTELAQRVRRRVDQEEELVIDPHLFAALPARIPQIAKVEIHAKRGRFHNELTRFRYDVVLHIGTEESAGSDLQPVDWRRQGLRLESLRQFLEDDKPDDLFLTQVPNARLSSAIEACKMIANPEGPGTAGEIRTGAGEMRNDDAVDHEDLWELADQLSYNVSISYSGSDPTGALNLMFKRRRSDRPSLPDFPADGQQLVSGKPLTNFTNNPLRGRLYNALVPELRSHLRAKLPEYMVPQTYVMLDALPLTPNGKVDRRALPAPISVAPYTKRDLAEPRTEYEFALKRIWEELLGVRPIGVRDNFFELGGHSLLAVRMMNEITKTYGRSIPLVSLFQGATIEQLASILREDTRQQTWPALIEILKGNDRPPLFCVSMPNVNALGYVALARHLGSDQTVYGLQAQYPEDLQGEHSNKAVDELAKEYLEAIRAVRPHGLYQLAGMCRGAHIALEMARRLESQGESVALVGIFDTWVIENTYNRPLFLGQYYFERFTSRLRLALGDQLGFIKGKPRSANGNAAQAAPTPLENPVADQKNPYRAYFPGPDFVPKTYLGRVAIFRTKRQPLNRIRDPQLGWGKLAGGILEVHIVPGKHGDVLREPNVQSLAEELKKCLLEKSD